MEYEFIVFDEFSSESDETLSLWENERIDRLMRSKNSWSNRMLEIMLDMGFFYPRVFSESRHNLMLLPLMHLFQLK